MVSASTGPLLVEVPGMRSAIWLFGPSVRDALQGLRQPFVFICRAVKVNTVGDGEFNHTRLRHRANNGGSEHNQRQSEVCRQP